MDPLHYAAIVQKALLRPQTDLRHANYAMQGVLWGFKDQVHAALANAAPLQRKLGPRPPASAKHASQATFRTGASHVLRAKPVLFPFTQGAPRAQCAFLERIGNPQVQVPAPNAELERSAQ
jgi:hypothetical protein